MWRRRDRGECQVSGCDVRGSIEWVGSWETLRVGARCADLFFACMSCGAWTRSPWFGARAALSVGRGSAEK